MTKPDQPTGAGVPPVKKTLDEALADLEASKVQTAEFRDKHAPEFDAEKERSGAVNARLNALPQHERRQVLDAAGMHKVSAAPVPITPLQGSSYIQPLPPVPPPRWDRWGHMRDVELWEAVALSLNLEPSELPVYLGAYDRFGDDPFKICPPPFLDSLQIANSNCGISLGYKPVHKLKARCLVDLPNFATWALSLHINIPSEMVAMAATSQANKPNTPYADALEQSAEQNSQEYQAKYARAEEALDKIPVVHREIKEWENARADTVTDKKDKEQKLSALKMELAELQAMVDPDQSQQRITEPQAVPEKSPETADQRCTRLLLWLEEEKGKGERGALARVVKRDGRARQTVSADIERAQKQRKEASNPMAKMGRKITF